MKDEAAVQGRPANTDHPPRTIPATSARESVPRPTLRRTRLQEYVQALGDLFGDARAELDSRECSTWLAIVASRVAREIAARLEREERP